MANKKISELPYINGGKISGNTLVPLVTYFSATTGDTVHTYVSDLQTYLTSGLTGNTVVGDFLPLSGGTVTGQTFFTSGLTITGDTVIIDSTGTSTAIDTSTRELVDPSSLVSVDWGQRLLYDGTGTNSTIDYGSALLYDTNSTPSIDWGNRQSYDDSGIVSIDWSLARRRLYDGSSAQSADWLVRTLTKSDGTTISFDWENGILTGQTNVETSTISATTYLNLPGGFTGAYLPLSGGTVTGPSTFTSGVTANTLTVTGLTQTKGITSTGGITFPQITVNSNYTATTNDYMIDITGGTFNVQLPTAVGIQGKLYSIKNNGGGAVTVLPYGSEKLDDKSFLILSETNAVQVVSNGSQFIILGQDRSTVNNSTGVFQFSGLSKVSSTQFSVARVRGWIVDDTTNPLSPQIFYVDYSGGTHTDSYVTTAFETFVYLTSGGTIGQQDTPLTGQQRRQNIFLGKLGHPEKTSINLVFSQPDVVLSPLAQLRDMFQPINLINGGVYPSANGANLKFNTSAGYIYGLGINFTNNSLSPNALSISGESPCTFQYRTQTGGTVTNVTDIDPLNYDVAGTKTAITGTKATNQRIFLLQNGSFRVQYGQTTYNTMALAIEGLRTETFTTFPNFVNNAVLIGILTVLSTATDLTDTSKAQFFYASKFGETIGAAGGAATTTLQQAYNNSSEPEITINSTLDGVSIKNGTGNADNVTKLLEGLNTAGSTTSFIRADGAISATTISATTISATTYQNLPTDVRVTGSSYSNNTFTYTNNTGGTFNVLFNTVTGLTVNGNLTVTGNTNVRAFTGTSGTISGTGQNILTVVGSGNSTTSPLFSVQGSSGELFSINDSLVGSLFSVNDISGLPVVEVFSDNTTLWGSYQAPSLNTTTKVTLTAGTNTIYSIPTSGYTGAFYEYTLISTGSTGARAGQIMAIWSGTSANFTETTTTDIGTTTGVTFTVAVSGSNAVLSSSATTAGWTVKTIIRSI